ncbi:hypothetical protein CVT26_008352 [Gymnopilus dilepis]|uniref:Uncharacterized protein n=1 Tax=Gymnopilus dilepis TaxID=231916 RepID=A0A409XYA8_9AGAR|nr:hypothetical protein CVT26_008352 [Gymnopilus dilepis]
MAEHTDDDRAAPSITLPDDQSFRIIKLNQRTVILSVAENGIRLGKGTDIGNQVSGSEKGFFVFAENVALSDSFSVPLESKDALLTISTHDISLSPVATSTVDVSGASGVDNDKVLRVLATSTANRLGLFNLVLKARGGDGGDTIEKQGTAGNGGNGGNISFFSYSYITEISTMLLCFAQHKAWNRDIPGDDLLTPTHPIVVFFQDVLDTSSALPDPSIAGIASVSSILKPLVDICDKAKTLRPPTVDGARDAVWDARQDLKKQYDIDRLAVRTYIEAGLGGNATSSGFSGKPGARGNILSLDFVREVDAESLRKQTVVMVHPEWCKMLYDRAMTYWYFGRTETGIHLLDRLLLRTIFLPLKNSDALLQAYTRQESTLASKNSLAMQQNSVLQTGKVDFYGFGAHWVPRVSYTEYNDYINDALGVFIHLEQSYINYRTALDHQQQTNDAIQQAVSKINGTLSTMEEERKTVVESLANYAIRIEVSGPYNDFIEQVTRPPPKGISIGQLFNATSLVVTTPSKVGGAGKALSQLYSDFNGDPDTISNAAGVAVNKDYLMHMVENSVATGLEDFTGELTADELNGMFKVDGRVPKLIMEQEKLQDILAQYRAEAFTGGGDDLLQAYDDFIQALEARNDDITAYNSLIQRLIAQSQERQRLNDMKNLAQKGTLTNEVNVDGTALDLEVMTGYIRLLFENARARVMRYLSMGQRALTFKILQTRDLLSLEGSVGQTSDIPLSVTSDVLVTIRSNLQDLLLTATEENSGIPASFPANWDTGMGKRRWLSADELKSFLSAKSIDLTIDPVFPRQKLGNLSSDFESSANVRVYRVRFYLQGLKAKSGFTGPEPQMKAVILHGGNETIVSRRGVPHYFEHSPLNTLHSYSINASGKVVNIFDNGDLVKKTDDVKDSAFGAPGPFTRWTVNSTSAEWSRLDVSGVTSAYLEFFGTNYAFFN